MPETAPIWPARLDHICIATEQPDEMLAFYCDAVGYRSEQIDSDMWKLSGHRRSVLMTTGAARRLAFMAFWLDDSERLARFRGDVAAKGGLIENSNSPLFGDEAFAVSDPDGIRLVFGLADYQPAGDDGGLGAELQHLAVATRQLEKMQAFYAGTLGMQTSDNTFDQDGKLASTFFRSDSMHHTVAMFGADYSELDHHSYEVQSWNAIRDWADHFAARRIPLWWGPGRHGPGNNLFFMVEDPDNNKLEFSTELEVFSCEQAPRSWPHEEHSLNLWGGAWMRD